MEYIARINIGAGGSWQKADTEEEAIKGVIQRFKEDWSGIYDTDAYLKAGELEVYLFEDGGTCSFSDDVYIKSVIAE